MSIHKPASRPSRIAILGAGAWGATLAWLYGSLGKNVALWARDPEKASAIAAERVVRRPNEIAIPHCVEVTSDLGGALRGASIVLFCCNSQAMRSVAGKVASHLGAGNIPAARKPVLVSAAKGLELKTLNRMSEVLKQTLPDFAICALSGPNLSGEILDRKPTASVVASDDAGCAAYVQDKLSAPTLRIYTNPDLAGVELGGTLKNIIAIAAGCSDGLSLGNNAKAALLTRGLAEITRLAVKLGANPLTLAGLAGMGDLIATCTSPLSRNYRLGLTLARGVSVESALSGLGATAEGVTTCEAVCELSQKLGIELPIAQQVEATLKGKTSPERAIMTLMSRPLASEEMPS